MVLAGTLCYLFISQYGTTQWWGFYQDITSIHVFTSCKQSNEPMQSPDAKFHISLWMNVFSYHNAKYLEIRVNVQLSICIKKQTFAEAFLLFEVSAATSKNTSNELQLYILKYIHCILQNHTHSYSRLILTAYHSMESKQKLDHVIYM